MNQSAEQWKDDRTFSEAKDKAFSHASPESTEESLQEVNNTKDDKRGQTLPERSPKPFRDNHTDSSVTCSGSSQQTNGGQKSGQTSPKGNNPTDQASRAAGTFSGASCSANNQGSGGGGDDDDSSNNPKKNLPADKALSGADEDAGTENESSTDIKNETAATIPQQLFEREPGRISVAQKPDRARAVKNAGQLDGARRSSVAEPVKGASGHPLPTCSDDQQEEEATGLGNDSDGVERDYDNSVWRFPSEVSNLSAAAEKLESKPGLILPPQQKVLLNAPALNSDPTAQYQLGVRSEEISPTSHKSCDQQQSRHIKQTGHLETTLPNPCSASSSRNKRKKQTRETTQSKEDQDASDVYGNDKEARASKIPRKSKAPPYKVKLQNEVERNLRPEIGGLLGATTKAGSESVTIDGSRDANSEAVIQGHPRFPHTTVSMKGKRNCSPDGRTNADHIPTPGAEHLDSAESQEKSGSLQMKRERHSTTSCGALSKQSTASTQVCSDTCQIPLQHPNIQVNESFPDQEPMEVEVEQQHEDPEAQLGEDENSHDYAGLEFCIRCAEPVDADHDCTRIEDGGQGKAF